MRKNESLKWSQFALTEIFKISATQSSIDKNKLTGVEGMTPYITRTDSDNGIDHFIGNQPDYNTDEGNVITIGLDTQTVFYQPTSFYTGQNIQVLRSEHLNKYVALYIIPLIKKQMTKFNWGGNGATLGRLKKLSLFLPCTASKEPNYSYMESFMREKEKKLLRRYKRYILNRYSPFIPNSNQVELNSTNWSSFMIEEIGEVKPGKDIYERERIDGRTPYITATALQNGIGYFVGNHNDSLSEGCISVNRNGSVGYSFYHPYQALFGNDTRRLIPFNTNRYANIFLTSAIMKQKDKYSYGLKMGTERLKKQYIVIPVDETNKPDYTFMTHYMKRVEITLLSRFVNNRLSEISNENI